MKNVKKTTVKKVTADSENPANLDNLEFVGGRGVKKYTQEENISFLQDMLINKTPISEMESKYGIKRRSVWARVCSLKKRYMKSVATNPELAQTLKKAGLLVQR